MINLRDYQSESVQSVYTHLREREDNPCIVIPTGGGKTPVIAQICTDAVTKWGGRVCVLAHVKELLEQSATTLERMAPELNVGVYSAGLNRRDTGAPVICAGIQSVYSKPGILGEFNLVIVDEAHMIPPDGEGMYRTFLQDQGKARVIGLTATPYRTGTGMICGKDNILNKVCHETRVKELIVRGYLSKIVSKGGHDKPDLSKLHTRMGEFVQEEMEAAFRKDELIAPQVIEIVERTRDRKSVLIFSAGVAHGDRIAEMLRNITDDHVAELYGDTPAGERASIIENFRAGEIKYLVNVAVLTTGFDAPGVDCVVLLRATQSPGLYYQMVGRGFRIAEGKADCLVLDFGQNIVRHGPVDVISPQAVAGNGKGEAPAKECENCLSIVPTATRKCPDCGHEFPAPDRGGNLDTVAGAESVISEPEWLDVREVFFEPWEKQGWQPGDPRTVRVRYKISFAHEVSEWICPEHEGYARAKFVAWWQDRSMSPIPENVEQVMAYVENEAIAKTNRIKVGQEGKYDRVLKHDLEKPPEYSFTKPASGHNARTVVEDPATDYDEPF